MPGEHNGSPRRRVVILGGGFGGLAAAQTLRRADVEVTLVDRTNHHLFQPLLYQLAAGAIAAGECAAPLRGALRRSANTTVVMAEATDVDADRRQVILDGGERLDYDSLIVACGARTSYFGHDEWEHVSCGLKTLGDALDLRNRVYAAFEQAERARDRGVARRVADVRRRRRWSHRGGDRRSARAPRGSHAKAQLRANRPHQRARDPARRRRARRPGVQREAVRQGGQIPRRARRDRARGRPRHRDRPARRHDRRRRGDRTDPGPNRDLGGGRPRSEHERDARAGHRSEHGSGWDASRCGPT